MVREPLPMRLRHHPRRPGTRLGPFDGRDSTQPHRTPTDVSVPVAAGQRTGLRRGKRESWDPRDPRTRSGEENGPAEPAKASATANPLRNRRHEPDGDGEAANAEQDEHQGEA